MRREPFRSNTYGIHLTALAVADILNVILSALFKDSTVYFLDTDIRVESVIMCSLILYLMSAAKGFISSNIAFISIERFIAVWFPLKAKHLFS